MDKLIVDTGTQTLVRDVTLERIELTPDCYLFRRTTRTAAEPHKGECIPPIIDRDPDIESGFVDKKGLAALYAGQPAPQSDLVVLSDKHLKAARTKGFDAIAHLINENPWTLFHKDPTLTSANVVRVDHASNMLFDLAGAPVPVAEHMDYLEGRISESRYDLQALAAHMLTHPDIRVLSSSSASGYAKTTAEAIMTIPSYNAEPGRTQSIEFVWVPRPEDYVRVWDACTGRNRSTKMIAQFFALDIAGFAQFRIKPSAQPTP